MAQGPSATRNWVIRSSNHYCRTHDGESARLRYHQSSGGRLVQALIAAGSSSITRLR